MSPTIKAILSKIFILVFILVISAALFYAGVFCSLKIKNSDKDKEKYLKSDKYKKQIEELKILTIEDPTNLTLSENGLIEKYRKLCKEVYEEFTPRREQLTTAANNARKKRKRIEEKEKLYSENIRKAMKLAKKIEDDKKGINKVRYGFGAAFAFLYGIAFPFFIYDYYKNPTHRRKLL